MTTSHPIIIATRESPLAMWQAEHVQARLRELHAGTAVELAGVGWVAMAAEPG